jgi:transposase-like protein
MDMIQMNDNLNACVPEVCPVCGAEHVRFYRCGIHGKKRRWCCSKCKHKFTDDSHTITSNLNIERDAFVQICMETLNMVPIRKRAERLDVSVQCVFNNRHTFLSLLEEIFGKEKELMTGTIEGGETYILESAKESIPENRKSRHRGGHSGIFSA